MKKHLLIRLKTIFVCILFVSFTSLQLKPFASYASSFTDYPSNDNVDQTLRWNQSTHYTTQTIPSLSGNYIGGVAVAPDGRAFLTIYDTDKIDILSGDRKSVTTLTVPAQDGGLSRFIAFHNGILLFVNGQYVYAYDEIEQTFRQITDRRNSYHGISVNDDWIALATGDPCGGGYAVDIYNFSTNIYEITFQKAFAKYLCYPEGFTVIPIDSRIAAPGDVSRGWWSNLNLVGNTLFTVRGNYNTTYVPSTGGIYEIDIASETVTVRDQSSVIGLLSEHPISSLYDPALDQLYYSRGGEAAIYNIDIDIWNATQFTMAQEYLWYTTKNELITSQFTYDYYSSVERRYLNIYDKLSGDITIYNTASSPGLISDYVSYVDYRADTDEIYIATNSGLTVLSDNVRSLLAADLAQTVVGGEYLWGGKGWDLKLRKFVDAQQILTDGYNYWNPKKTWDAVNRIWIGGLDFGRGLDCSGLVLWAYNHANGATSMLGGPIKYEGADGQYRYCTVPVNETDLAPGNLLFFDNDNNGVMDHVAMYVGEVEGYDVVHASQPGVGIVWALKDTLNDLPGFRAYGAVVPCQVEIAIKTGSPIHLIVTDPDGYMINIDMLSETSEEGLVEIPGVLYYSVDVNLDDIVYAPVLKTGTYLIQAVPKPDASLSDTYSIEVINGSTVIVLAQDVSISDIPTFGYAIESTGSEIYQANVFQVLLPMITK
jgi:hypothetical protein